MENISAITTEIFRTEMKLADVGPNDNFFDMGGDSLMAENIVLALQQRFNLTMPTSILLQAPTPGELAGRVTTLRASEQFKNLITTVPGCGGAEPAVMIHGMSGSPLFVNRFQNGFKSACQLYAVRGMGLSEGENPLTTVQDLANAYLDGVRLVTRTPPRIFGGICLGGLIAVEMARMRYEETGDRCALILIDPPPLGSAWLKPMPDNRMTAQRARSLDRQVARARGLRDTLDKLGMGRTIPGRKARRETFKRSLTRAMAGFTPEGFPCDVLVVASSDWGQTTVEEYRNWCPKEAAIRCVALSGTHKGFQNVNRDEIDREVAAFLGATILKDTGT